MYRLIKSATRGGCTCSLLRFSRLSTLLNSASQLSTDSNSSISQSPNHIPNTQPEAPNYSHSKSEEPPRHDSHNSRRPRIEYQDEQARVLQASLPHVIRLGWTEAAMIAGARKVGLSPSIVGDFAKKEAALVEVRISLFSPILVYLCLQFFMDECLQRLIDIIESDEELKNILHSDRISKLVKTRLEMQAPYLSKWPQALSIQAQPMNVPTSFKQRAMLVDEIWHAVGDEVSDIDWYVKCTILGGIYSTTEIYMLTDNSPDFRDTWAFLENRVKDAFDLKKTILEAKYLAEAVGAGMGSSLQGFMRNVFQGTR